MMTPWPRFPLLRAGVRREHGVRRAPWIAKRRDLSSIAVCEIGPTTNLAARPAD
jgi:hypothetical protein